MCELLSRIYEFTCDRKIRYLFYVSGVDGTQPRDGKSITPLSSASIIHTLCTHCKEGTCPRKRISLWSQGIRASGEILVTGWPASTGDHAYTHNVLKFRRRPNVFLRQHPRAVYSMDLRGRSLLKPAELLNVLLYDASFWLLIDAFVVDFEIMNRGFIHSLIHQYYLDI